MCIHMCIYIYICVYTYIRSMIHIIIAYNCIDITLLAPAEARAVEALIEHHTCMHHIII